MSVAVFVKRKLFKVYLGSFNLAFRYVVCALFFKRKVKLPWRSCRYPPEAVAF